MRSAVRRSFRLSRRPFDVCSHAGSCHSSCAQHFVCIPAPLLHIRPALWRWVSVRASDAALPHLPPAGRSVPPLCSHPLAEPLRAERMNMKNRYFWPIVTQTLFLYTYTHSRRLRHHVTKHNIFICNALFVTKVEDVLRLHLDFPSFHLYEQPCSIWKV